MNLAILEPKLPGMRCDAGCGSCCGPVTCNADEMARVKAYAAANGITPARNGITCPFFQGGTCAVHPVRPFICRLFGHSPKLVCERGHNVNVPNRREAKLMEGYFSAGTPDLWLHALVYTEAEMFGILVSDLSPARPSPRGVAVPVEEVR